MNWGRDFGTRYPGREPSYRGGRHEQLEPGLGHVQSVTREEDLGRKSDVAYEVEHRHANGEAPQFRVAAEMAEPFSHRAEHGSVRGCVHGGRHRPESNQQRGGDEERESMAEAAQPGVREQRSIRGE
ncbi:hypothetical protein GCM10009721_28320 [Terrabacter tumescens]|uniref:Uncharacterized protein n=1 Tax=Terrabacter tumescens TaxID=60443 RepID=A0ABQ2I6L9_9MICO|nr:hypothetical protein GCM10009721_28320 [Terrabacter tumescens]